MRIHTLGALLVGTMAGCIGNLTPIQRAQDAANEFTTATRFGRMDMALERVSREDREAFVRRHAAWGTTVRIVDCDILGVRLTDREHAEVTLAVSWQRVDESEMRVTHLAQHWDAGQQALMVHRPSFAGRVFPSWRAPSGRTNASPRAQKQLERVGRAARGSARRGAFERAFFSADLEAIPAVHRFDVEHFASGNAKDTLHRRSHVLVHAIGELDYDDRAFAGSANQPTCHRS